MVAQVLLLYHQIILFLGPFIQVSRFSLILICQLPSLGYIFSSHFPPRSSLVKGMPKIALIEFFYRTYFRGARIDYIATI